MLSVYIMQPVHFLCKYQYKERTELLWRTIHVIRQSEGIVIVSTNVYFVFNLWLTFANGKKRALCSSKGRV